MQNLFSFRFSENIWRVMPDADSGSSLWAIELRNVERREVSFAVLDTDNLAINWQRHVEGTDWWTSLTAFSDHHIFLHNYRYPEVPEPTDLLAVNAETGLLSWILSNHLLVSNAGNGLLEIATKQGDSFKHLHCNATTGEVQPLIAGQTEPGEEIILTEPVRYNEGNRYFGQLAQFISNATGGHNPVAIDYLEKRPYIIFSYYIYEQDKTVQYLLIVTDQKQQVLHEKLSEEREGTGRSTMMLKASTLVYLKNSNEFSSLTLS
ncbi:DUF4905 domain-containing protein [Dyadobacter jiangsuensis]|uniref:DUF4905 domain-containing protein n=1 Tax=Dyadobacter fermentans TaxID=94254 RepID=UPI001CBC758B|nr:DUF4905 domain-containing protein [Dyadobacter fermentans]MBZ1358185.1 DUF4905 domain-containing protein [Dyadobacter fermentans]